MPHHGFVVEEICLALNKYTESTGKKQVMAQQYITSQTTCFVIDETRDAHYNDTKTKTLISLI